jgi:hypothetical protein
MYNIGGGTLPALGSCRALETVILPALTQEGSEGPPFWFLRGFRGRGPQPKDLSSM